MPCVSARCCRELGGHGGHLENSTPASSFRNRRRVPERNTPSALVRTHALESVECSLPERTASARLMLRPRCPLGRGLVKSCSTCGDSWSVAVGVLPVSLLMLRTLPRGTAITGDAHGRSAAGARVAPGCGEPRRRPTWSTARASCDSGRHRPRSRPMLTGIGFCLRTGTQHPPMSTSSAEFVGHGGLSSSLIQHPPFSARAGETHGGVSCSSIGPFGTTMRLRIVQGAGVELP